MRVGEVARRAGVNVETLRYYERCGLLPEPARTPNGHRRYDAETVQFIRSVKEAQSLGFSLAEIKELMRVARRGPTAASHELRVRLAAKIDEVDARLDALGRMRADLARVVGCACDSLDRCTCGAGFLARRTRERDAAGHERSTLHVTNGDSVTRLLHQSSLEGVTLSWQDALHEGPVPAGSRTKLLAARASFLAACGWGPAATIRAGLAQRDQQLLDALGAGREVVLWFEHDLFDQLQLIDALSLVAGVSPASVELIVIGSFPGRPHFRGLGELTPPELESLWPKRRAVTPELLADALAAWTAVRAPDPTGMAKLAGRDSRELPFLGAALERLLEELPGTVDGLSGVERRALRAVQAGARSPADAFAIAQEDEPAPFLGDTWFFRTLAGLGAGSHGLIESAAGTPLPAPPPLGRWDLFAGVGLRLTESGRRVLAGDADRVLLLGLDRFVGGVHLVPGADWRWDSSTRQLVAPPI